MNKSPNLIRPKITSYPSINARNLEKGWQLFSKGLKITISNGQDTSLWNDNWLGDGSLSSMLYGPLKEEDYMAPVSSIINLANELWDFEKSHYTLLIELLRRILATPFSLCPNFEDCIGWNYSSSDNFNLASAYVLSVCDLDWIWKLKTLPKVCLHKLPTRHSLFTKHLLPDNLCTSYFSEETCRHFLCECPRSLLFWQKLGFTPSPPPNNNLIDWFKVHSSKVNTIHNIHVGTLFLFGC
ncbi:hypothetical protein LIER_23907 [Lithospermum erythrorhizon]|uniref:Reverse transcriptase zinc-binding domain-containing protein n=1 Tax=Lithospermum erythrorhizon TaxID=34254 RepID=A0AAV3R252_LITER